MSKGVINMDIKVKIVEESERRTRGFPNSLLVENEDGEWMLFTPLCKVDRALIEKRGKVFERCSHEN